MDIFWKTIAEYNASTWAIQICIILIGVLITSILILKPNKSIRYAIKLYLTGIYTWIGVVYYAIYCEERGYSDILCYFWLLMAGAWLWDLVTGYTPFERNYKYSKLAYILMIMPLIYPLLSLFRGLEFPSITSPVMPCSVATFTIGLLLYHSKKINMFIVLFLCHWSLIGLTKTYFFDIPEDYLLVATSVPAIYLFFRQYFLSDLNKDTKPNAKLINLLLIGVCLAIGLVLGYTLFAQIIKHPETIIH